MAEGILPPGMAELLNPRDPQQQRALTLAALAQAGQLGSDAPPIPSPSEMGFMPPQFPDQTVRTPGSAMAQAPEPVSPEDEQAAIDLFTTMTLPALGGPIATGW
jgi:hypothetical protein